MNRPLLAIVLGGFSAAFLAIVDFYLFYCGPVDMQILTLLTRSKCKVPNTQVTVKAHEPFIHIFFT